MAAAELPNLTSNRKERLSVNDYHNNYIHELLISSSNDKFKNIYSVIKTKTSENIQTTDEGIHFCN